jgi:DNA-binding helix-hairpin-helix protein with protein kinase domain
MSALVKEKRALQARANQLREQLAEEDLRLDEIQKRREHLFRKEQSGRDATLFNLQKHHIEKGLSTYQVKEAVIPRMEPGLKERLAESGIHTALDVTEEAVSQLAELGTADRLDLMDWRSTLYTELDATKPLKLPDYQLEYIQKKFRRLHAANDEKGKIAADYHQQITAALNANKLRLQQLASVTFRGYLVNALLSKSIQPG